MSIVQFTPCIIHSDWAGFVEWCARTFDLPVACRFDDKGWARLAATSPGLTVLDCEPFRASSGDNPVVVELEVYNVRDAVVRAVSQGAILVTEPVGLGEGQWHAAIQTPQGIGLFLFQAAPAQGAGVAGNGPVHFTVSRTVKAPLETVFDAITRPEHLEKAFVTRAGPAITATGQAIVWNWEGHGDATLHVTVFRPNAYVAFHWQANHQTYHTSVEFKVSAEAGGTRLAVTESGWRSDDSGLQSAFDHCEGWTQFVDNIKVYLEHGIVSMAAAAV